MKHRKGRLHNGRPTQHNIRPTCFPHEPARHRVRMQCGTVTRDSRPPISAVVGVFEHAGQKCLARNTLTNVALLARSPPGPKPLTCFGWRVEGGGGGGDRVYIHYLAVHFGLKMNQKVRPTAENLQAAWKTPGRETAERQRCASREAYWYGSCVALFFLNKVGNFEVSPKTTQF